MRISRIFQNSPMKIGDAFALSDDVANYISNVLRLKKTAPLLLFNGHGGEFSATIVSIEKRKISVLIEKFHDIERESPLAIHLAQGISRGEKMDLTIQKAVELGVQKITPIITERCGVQLSEERQEKRLEHWKKIIISACEQCGRNRLPILTPVMTIDDYMTQESTLVRLMLDHHASTSLGKLDQTIKEIALLIGSEGGLTTNERLSAENHRFTPITLGPRILRTETAGLAIISILQNKLGDMSNLSSRGN